MAKNPFGYKVEVEGVDSLKKSLSVAEKQYVDLSKTLGKTASAINDNARETNKLGETTKVVAKKAIDAGTAREKSAVSTGNKISGALKREASALSSLGISWGSLAALIGGGTIVGFIGKAVSSFLSFDRAVRELNVTLYGNARVMSVAAGMIQSLNGYLDLTREEVKDIVMQGAELGMFAEGGKKAAASLKNYTMQVIWLSKATNTSTASVGDLFFTMTKLYRLPENKLRNIAAAFSYIQKATAASGEELASYVKKLDELFFRMPQLSDDTKVRVTSDMMAIGGVFKKFGGEMSDIPSLMGKMLHLGSAEGEAALAELSVMSGRTMDSLRASLRSGDVVTTYKELGTALASIPLEELMYNSQRFQQTLGMDYKSIIALRRSVTEGGAEFENLIDKARKAATAGDAHQKAANARQNQLLSMWARLKNAIENVFIRFGEQIVKVVTKVAVWAIPKLIEGLEWLMRKIDWFGSPEGTKTLDEWAKKVYDAFDWVKREVFLPGRKMVREFIEGWNGLDATGKSIAKWAAGAAVAIKLLGGPLTVVAAGLLAIKKAYDWIDAEHKKRMVALVSTGNLVNDALRVSIHDTEGRVETVKRLMQQGLLTERGGINPAMIMTKAIEASKSSFTGLPDFKKAQALAAQWTSGLATVMSTGQSLVGTGSKVLQHKDVATRAIQSMASDIVPVVSDETSKSLSAAMRENTAMMKENNELMKADAAKTKRGSPFLGNPVGAIE